MQRRTSGHSYTTSARATGSASQASNKGPNAHEHGCGNCSNCRTDFAVEDVTDAARSIVAFVRATGGRFGKAAVADALHGANNDRIRKFRLDAAPGYGELSQERIGRIKDVISQLVGRGYLAQSPGRFPTVALGPRAAEAFADNPEAPFSFTMKSRAPKARASKRAQRAVDLLREEAALDARPRVGDDGELYGRLRELRREIASERRVAPYMVFNDATLRDMCRRRPATSEELLNVKGVGEKKAADFGDRFLAEVSAFEDLHR